MHEPASMGRRHDRRSHAALVRLFGVVAVVHLAILATAAVARARDVVFEQHSLELTDVLGLVVLATAVALAVGLRSLVRVARALSAEAETVSTREAQWLETTSEWIWSIDRDGGLLSSNSAVEQMLGYRVEDLVGRSCLGLAHADEAEVVERLLHGDGSDGWSHEVVRHRHRDGGERWLESSASPIRDDEGTIVGYRGATQDVTKRVLDSQAATATRDAFRERRARITSALADPEAHLRMAFQPVIARDGSIAGVEALARFTGPPSRTPDQWFLEADGVGLGLELELLALHLAVADIPSLPGRYVAVNLSPASVMSEELAAIVAEPSFPADRVVVELTEHVEVTRYDDLRAAIVKLRAAGLRIAVDDAGSGFSSLKHILELRPDFIKLDRTMVSGIHADPARRALAAAVADFAAHIDARVIAEGVETIEELRTVQVAGIDFTQGFLFGQPTPPPVTAHTPEPSGVRAIIVDDDPVVRLLVSGMARQAGIQVVGQASDGREGLELASAEKPDVVVLDLSMPVMRGEEALPQLRRRLPDASIIVLSSLSNDGVANRLALGPADAFVAKNEVTMRLGAVFAAMVSGNGVVPS